MSHSFETYFKSLEGSWFLERKISSGETLNGKAVFEATSDTAFLMREEGKLVLPNKTKISASRNWYWHLSNDNALEITYDEARFKDYHHIYFGKHEDGWRGTAQHLCGADLYSGEYKFFEGRFEITQTIKGPKKGYVISSIYSK
jgi:hypothetical protein